jgi:hypothetical protein
MTTRRGRSSYRVAGGRDCSLTTVLAINFRPDPADFVLSTGIFEKIEETPANLIKSAPVIQIVTMNGPMVSGCGVSAYMGND